MKGHIRERSPGHWAIVVDVRDPQTGKRKRRWHSFAGTKRAAQIECARIVSESAGGLFVDPGKITVAAFLDRWLDHMRSQLTPKSHERYCDVARKNVTPLLGAIPLLKLTPVHISDCYAKALSSGRRIGSGGLSAATVAYMHRILKQALSQAVVWRLLPRNPAAAVKAPRAERSRLTTYDIPQTAHLIDGLRGSRLLIPVLLAAMCGLRRGEIVALRWRHIDLVAGKISVVESATDGGRRALQTAEVWPRPVRRALFYDRRGVARALAEAGGRIPPTRHTADRGCVRLHPRGRRAATAAQSVARMDSRCRST
jgi:integrase